MHKLPVNRILLLAVVMIMVAAFLLSGYGEGSVAAQVVGADRLYTTDADFDLAGNHQCQPAHYHYLSGHSYGRSHRQPRQPGDHRPAGPPAGDARHVTFCAALRPDYDPARLFSPRHAAGPSEYRDPTLR